ncbi:MAG: hypothetical protein H7Y32_00140 [Chloroflexales bacterium]|nr:hypothetical protein [Chloroflexales bacterium]
MAITSRDLHPERRSVVSLPSARSASKFAYIITFALALLALYVLLSGVLGWAQVKLDDIRYGRPRTFQLAAMVGHGEESGTATQLIAMNLNRQVMILEVPGGDATKTRSIVGPYLFGAGEDLTPVTMRLADVNGDSAIDLLVQVKNEEMVYMNRNGGFELLTAEERKQLMQGAAK